jgi:hypothetical protein
MDSNPKTEPDMTTALILNVILAAIVFTTVVGLIVRGIATAHRDRGLAVARRATVTRRPAPEAAFLAGRSGRQAWPAS